jgi:hypothetical protein
MSEETNTGTASTPAPPKKKPVPRKKPAPAKKEPKSVDAKETAGKTSPINDGDPTERTRKELAIEKKVTVVINSTAEDKDDVFVALNGFAFTIQRDKEVQIPFSVYQVLMDAKSTVYRQVKREDGEGMQMVETEIQRFSMSARF